MSQRLEFVQLAARGGVNFRELCRRYRISAPTGYKWLARYRSGGAEALADRSRRPQRSPRCYAGPVAAQVVALYEQWGWGGRKLRRRLLALGQEAVPAASTCTAILRRAGRYLDQPAPTKPYQRFERAQPNELWQMDFKGEFNTQAGSRCYPFTVLDDHSRFSLALMASPNRNGQTVQQALSLAFAIYGLPEAILCDNGPPWGQPEPVCPYTTFTVWLLRLGVQIYHGRPYHPQTQGKDERFHRTLKRELLSRHTWRDLTHCAREFPAYRQRYNTERPHDSLGGATPLSRYQPSARTLPRALPTIEYPAGTSVHTVRTQGALTFHGQTWYVGRAFAGQPIGLQPQAAGLYQVYFAEHLLGQIDLRTPLQPKHSLRSIYSTYALSQSVNDVSVHP